jgi:CRISPR-associated protein Cas1
MLKGRLGLEGARVPQSDRHGLLWLGRGNLYVESGTLRFKTAGFDELPSGDYAIAYQTITCVVLQPGTTISHDALRILARHGTGVVAVGEGGTRFYASMPFGPDTSRRARRQVEAWADPDRRIAVARTMYAWRLGELLPTTDINSLRGIEGARMKRTYETLAEQYGIAWRGRRYDRMDPNGADLPNQAINHASSAIEAPAMVAVAVTGTIPQLGFIHEDSGIAFPLDIADIYRGDVLLPVAFSAVKQHLRDGSREPLEKQVRRQAARVIVREKLIGQMIERIKSLFDPDGTPESARAQ